MTLQATTLEVARLAVELELIKKVVAENYGIPVAALLAGGRAEPHVTHRQVAMFLCRELTKGSFPDIARAFEKKDHETIRHACEVVPVKASRDENLRFNLERLRRVARKAVEENTNHTKR